MPRLTAYEPSPEPLQTRRAIAIARNHPDHPHSLRSGTSAVAPRLAFVFATAGLIQLLMHWYGR
jgi:hypothetical protein